MSADYRLIHFWLKLTISCCFA